MKKRMMITALAVSLFLTAHTGFSQSQSFGAEVGYRTGLGYPVGVYAYASEFASVGIWGSSDSVFGWGVNGVAEGPDSVGVRGIANSFTSVTYGVYGEASSPDGFGARFENNASSGDGSAVSIEGRTGLIVNSTDGVGVHVTSSGGTIGDDAIRGEHTEGDGVVGYSGGSGNLDNGVIGYSDGGYGIYGFSNASGQYAAYFDGPVYAGGGIVGASYSMVSVNTSTSDLMAGDTVQAAGVQTLSADSSQPVTQVEPAETTDQTIGVVLGRVEQIPEEQIQYNDDGGIHFGSPEGTSEPGDYLVVIVQGMAKVRVDTEEPIQAGMSLSTSSDGAVSSDDGSTSFAKVLDSADEDGLAWALVGLR